MLKNHTKVDLLFGIFNNLVFVVIVLSLKPINQIMNAGNKKKNANKPSPKPKPIYCKLLAADLDVKNIIMNDIVPYRYMTNKILIHQEK